nr:hypothetical protein CFP56_42279 [Quercus suber]
MPFSRGRMVIGIVRNLISDNFPYYGNSSARDYSSPHDSIPRTLAWRFECMSCRMVRLSRPSNRSSPTMLSRQSTSTENNALQETRRRAIGPEKRGTRLSHVNNRDD